MPRLVLKTFGRKPKPPRQTAGAELNPPPNLGHWVRARVASQPSPIFRPVRRAVCRSEEKNTMAVKGKDKTQKGDISKEVRHF